MQYFVMPELISIFGQWNAHSRNNNYATKWISNFPKLFASNLAEPDVWPTYFKLLTLLLINYENLEAMKNQKFNLFVASFYLELLNVNVAKSTADKYLEAKLGRKNEIIIGSKQIKLSEEGEKGFSD